jgi:hypothetical protein
MGSGATIYIPSSTETGSGIQNLIGGENIHTHTEKGWNSYKPILGK